jgi:hypothetical protein
VRRIIAVILALATLIGFGGALASSALADGDPASDVLVFDSVFNPPDSGASPEQAARLAATVKAANRAGYPIRVALIKSSGDLGTVTQLWQEPADYSLYLGRELSLQFHGVVLVVMPQGYGLYVPQKTPPTQDVKVMNREVAPGSDVADGAQRAVVALAKANGVSVNVGAVAVHSGSGGSGSLLPLAGFIVGLIGVAGAWGVSLTARPIRRRSLA